MHDDLTVLSDRTWGWDDDYRQLGRVAREAIRAHPGDYARGVAKDIWRLFSGPSTARWRRPQSPSGAGSQPPSRRRPHPRPTSEPIPSSREAPYISTPDGRIREVWTSPTEHSLVFRDPADAARSAALDREVNELLGGLPTAGPPVARDTPQRPLAALPTAVHVAPGRARGRPLAPPERDRGSTALAAAALAVMVSTSLAVYAVAEYSVPVVPAFVLLATTGSRLPDARTRSLHSRDAERPLARTCDDWPVYLTSGACAAPFAVLAIILGAAWIARLSFVVAIGDAHSLDVDYWRGALAALDEGRNPYETGVLNWPPLWLVVIEAVDSVAGLLGVAFCDCAAGCTSSSSSRSSSSRSYVTLVSYGAGRAAARRALLVGIALNPVAIILVCQHGNSDVQVGLLVTLAVAALGAHQRSRALVSMARRLPLPRARRSREDRAARARARSSRLGDDSPPAASARSGPRSSSARRRWAWLSSWSLLRRRYGTT